MALPLSRKLVGLAVRRRRPAAVLIVAGLGLLQAPAASAVDFCRAVANAHPPTPPYPPYVASSNLSLPYQPPTASQAVIPKTPVTVTVDGRDYPICAVYMSINDSGKQFLPDSSLGLNYPTLEEQPWFTAPGGSFAQAMTTALIANGRWNDGTSNHYWYQTPGPAVTTTNDGKGLLVNPDSIAQPTDSRDSPYFLWDVVGGPMGKTRAVWFNTSSQQWLARDSDNPDLSGKYWYWVLDPANGNNGNSVPGPVPLMGVAAAFGWSRRLRRRLADGRPPTSQPARSARSAP